MMDMMVREEVIMELTKYRSKEVLAHIRHDMRQLPSGKTYGNEAIDMSLSKGNYSLISRGKTPQEVNAYRKKLEKEIYIYNRKNIIHAIEICVQCPSDCPKEQERAFFEETYRHITDKLPMQEKCVFLAEVHRDERHRTPDGSIISKNHMHIMYVPAVPDNKHAGYEYKMCADALTKRKQLRALHPDLQKHLDECGIKATVYKKKDGKDQTVALSVSQMKALTASTGIVIDKPITIEKLAEILLDNVRLRDEVAHLQSKNEDLTSKLKAAELSRVKYEEWGVNTWEREVTDTWTR